MVTLRFVNDKMIASALYGRKRRLRQWASCFRVSHLNRKSLRIWSKVLESSCFKSAALPGGSEVSWSREPTRFCRSVLHFCYSMSSVLPLFWSMHFYPFFISQAFQLLIWHFFFKSFDYFVLAVLEASQCIAAELKAEAGWNNVKIALIGPHLELAWKSKDPTFAIPVS